MGNFSQKFSFFNYFKRIFSNNFSCFSFLSIISFHSYAIKFLANDLKFKRDRKLYFMKNNFNFFFIQPDIFGPENTFIRLSENTNAKNKNFLKFSFFFRKYFLSLKIHCYIYSMFVNISKMLHKFFIWFCRSWKFHSIHSQIPPSRLPTRSIFSWACPWRSWMI